MIDAPVRHDDEIGGKVCRIGLHQNLRLACWTGAGTGVADDPARGVASRDGEQRFARLQRNVGDTLGRCLDRVERATFVSELVQRADEGCIGSATNCSLIGLLQRRRLCLADCG